MAELAYAMSTGNLEKLFKHVQTAGKPEKVTKTYLKGAGFTSSNDGYLVGMLKVIGFLGADGTPTERWITYKDSSKSRGVLAQALRDTYPALFQIYPDAHRKDDEAIRNWMRTQAPSASDTTVTRALNTFKALVGLSDFDGAVGAAAPVTADAAAAGAAASGGTGIIQTPGAHAPVININIQLEIPATDNPETYEHFFAAMKKHLFPE